MNEFKQTKEAQIDCELGYINVSLDNLKQSAHQMGHHLHDSNASLDSLDEEVDQGLGTMQTVLHKMNKLLTSHPRGVCCVIVVLILICVVLFVSIFYTS